MDGSRNVPADAAEGARPADGLAPRVDLRGVQAAVDGWIGQFEEGYWPPHVNLARLTEEVGELARLINHRFGPKAKKPEEQDQELGEELADILFVLVAIANEQGIDLTRAFDGVLAKYRRRDSDRWERKADMESAED